MSTKTKVVAPKGVWIATLVLTAITILMGLVLAVYNTFMSGGSFSADYLVTAFNNIKSGEFLIACAYLAKIAIYFCLLIALIVTIAKHDVHNIVTLPFGVAALLAVNLLADLAVRPLASQGGFGAIHSLADYLSMSRILDITGFLPVLICAVAVLLFTAISCAIRVNEKGAKTGFSVFSALVFVVAFIFPFLFLTGWDIDLALEALLVHHVDLTALTNPAVPATEFISVSGFEIAFVALSMILAIVTMSTSRELTTEELEAEKAAKAAKKAEKAAAKEAEKEEPAKEEPKAEEPAKEEPKAEEPVKEEPKTEEPKAEPVKEEPAKEEPKAEEPKAEEPAKEEPKVEEPAEKEAPTKKPAAKKPAAKKPAAKPEDTLTLKGKIYHLVKRDDGEWSIKANKGQKALKLFPNKVEAMAYAETLEAKGATVLVHASKGAKAGKIVKH